MMIDEATRQRIQAQLGDPKLASHYLKPDQMAWQPTEFPGIEMKLLCRDEARGMSTILFRMAPGAEVPLHEHTDIEQTYVMEGYLEDDEGRCGPGEFVWRPAGNTHVARAPEGALFLSIFLKPNRFVEKQPGFAQ